MALFHSQMRRHMIMMILYIYIYIYFFGGGGANKEEHFTDFLGYPVHYFFKKSQKYWNLETLCFSCLKFCNLCK